MSSDLRNPAAEKPARWLVGACLLAVYIVWGTTYFAIKVAIEGIAPFFLVGTCFVAAGVLLLGWQALRGAPAPTARQWGGAALVGFLLLVVGNGAVSVAEHWVYLARHRGRWVRCFLAGWIFRMARPDSARRC
jgi:drug/metabolite transporter (DMT)-like permease